MVEIDEEELGIIIEIKYRDDGNLEKGCQEALAQIKTKLYEEAFNEEGIKKVLKYGIACYKKRCRAAVLNLC